MPEYANHEKCRKEMPASGRLDMIKFDSSWKKLGHPWAKLLKIFLQFCFSTQCRQRVLFLC